jgi:hypothetical protein
LSAEAASNAASLDSELQAQVDAQLLEQGAFTPLEFLIDSGRLSSDDYDSWRRREIEFLDEALMGSKDRIRAQLEAAVAYARRIGLVEQSQEFYAWGSDARDGDTALRISADPPWQRLVAGRYVPAQNTPQMDLFFDNPIVALTNGIVRALCTRNRRDCERLLDRLYAAAPNHADLAAFDGLIAALDHLNRRIDEARQELDFLRATAPAAKRLLGFQARDLLGPLWRQLAEALEGRPYADDEPELHRSFALSQAQDWPGVGDSITREAQWWLHATLCLRLAQSAYHCRNRTLALTAWFHLCWRAPAQAAEALERHRHPDTGVTALWQQFVNSEEDLSLQDGAAESLGAADFPAWLLLREPGLALQLDAELPTGDTPAEASFRCVHRWIQARRANRQGEEMALRKVLKAGHPGLFRHLKQSAVAFAGKA